MELTRRIHTSTNMDNVGLGAYVFFFFFPSLNYLTSWKMTFFSLSIKAIIIWQQGVPATLNRHIHFTAPSLLTRCHISFRTPTGAVVVVKHYRIGRYPLISIT